MITNTEFTALTSAAKPIDSGRTAASCLFADSSLSLASGLRGTGVFGGAGLVGGDQRPTWAPVAIEARGFGYAPAANGAEHRGLMANGVEAAVAEQQHSKKRAFRGLTPWRDPA